MAKKSEINKKGRLAKSTLSVVLAASMVLTSSSFVWAAPVEDIAIVEEGVGSAVTESVAAPAADVQVADETENVGAGEYTFKSETFDMSEDTFKLGTDTQNKIWTEYGRTNVTMIAPDRSEAAPNLQDYMASSDYFVYLTNLDTEITTNLTGKKAATAIPTDIGNYEIEIRGTGIVNSNGDYVNGSTKATYAITQDVTDKAYPTIAQATYTGQAQEPELSKIVIEGITLKEDTDYKILGYENNINACEEADKAAYVEVQYLNGYEPRGTERFYFTIGKAAFNTANITVTSPVTFNATVQEPVVKVTYKHPGSTGTVELVEGTDYTVKDLNSMDVGEYDVLITPINNYYGGTITKKYKIEKQNFNKSTVEVTVADTYLGDKNSLISGKYKANVTLKDAKTGAIINPINYDIYYKQADNSYKINAPIADKAQSKGYGIKIIAKGSNYNAGDILSEYKVVDAEDSLQKYLAINGYSFTFKNDDNHYKIEGVLPEYITINGVKYYENGKVDKGSIKDEEADRFDVTFPKKEECNAAGTYSVTLTGKGVWAGQTATAQFKILPVDMNNAEVSAGVYKTSKGTITANVNVVDESQTPAYTLLNGVDFDFVIQKATGNKGMNYNVAITYKGNYKGSETVLCELDLAASLPLDVDAIKATVNGEYIYNGTRHKPTAENIILTEINGENSTQLRYGIDYEFVDQPYGTNVNVGKGQVYLLGKGSYTGFRIVEFEIKGGDTVKDNYLLDTTNLKSVYEFGTTFNPENDIVVKTTSGKILAKNVDYTIKYLRDGRYTDDKNKDAGVVTMEVTINASKTQLTAIYRIATALDKVTTIPASFADAEYTGAAIEPTIELLLNNTVVKLVEGTDYTVAYTNNVNVGTGYITIEGIGDYYGTYSRTFKIVGQMPQNFEFLAAQTRDIKKRTLASNATTVKYNKGQEPKTAVTYSSSDEKVFTVDATSGAIKYTGVGTATLTATAVESDIYKAETKTMTVRVTPRTPSKVSVTSASSKKITVKAAEVKEAAYYQIKIWKEGREPVYVNVKNAGDLSRGYTTKSAGTFHVQVRTFMYPGSKVADNYKSPFSSTHTVIVKK